MRDQGIRREVVNSQFKDFADAHCHLTDLRFEGLHPELFSRCAENGVQFFMQGGVSPEEWDRQIALAQAFPGKIGLCFGLHPYRVAQQSIEDSERDLDLLARKVGEVERVGLKVLALGEMGLDLRPQYLDFYDQQIEIFRMQLELARAFQKPVVLHLVRAFSKASQILRFESLDCGGMVHSFSGTWSEAKEYLDLGLCISVGARVLSAKPAFLEVLQKIPQDRLLLETDAPDQAPKGQLVHDSLSLFKIAEVMAGFWEMSPESVLDKSSRNLKNLLYGKHKSNR